MTTQYVTIQNPLLPGDVLAVTIAGTPPPPPPPPPPSGKTLQQIVDGTASGGSVDVSGLAFTAGAVITKPMRLYGTGWSIVGKTAYALQPQADGITIEGPEVSGFTPGYQHGAIEVVDRHGFTLLNAKLHDNTGDRGSGLSVIGGGTIVLQDVDAYNNNSCGVCIHGDFSQYGRVTSLLITRGHFYSNKGLAGAGWEAGGIKLVCADQVTINGLDTDGNIGPGVWFDGKCANAVVKGGHHHHNSRSGVMQETSVSGSVTGIAAWENAWGNPDAKVFAGWGGQVLISSSQGIAVTGNTLAWGASGVGAISQKRVDNPGSAAGDTATGDLIAVSAGRPPVSTYAEAGAPANWGPWTPNATATAAQLTAAGIPTAPEAGH